MPQPNKVTMIRTACITSLVALVAAALALQDISHGEADVTLEWHVVQASFAVMLVFHILSLRLARPRAGSPSPSPSDIR